MRGRGRDEGRGGKGLPMGRATGAQARLALSGRSLPCVLLKSSRRRQPRWHSSWEKKQGMRQLRAFKGGEAMDEKGGNEEDNEG